MNKIPTASCEIWFITGICDGYSIANSPFILVDVGRNKLLNLSLPALLTQQLLYLPHRRVESGGKLSDGD